MSLWTLHLVFWVTGGWFRPPTLVVEDIQNLGTVARCRAAATQIVAEMKEHTKGAVESYVMCIEINPPKDQASAGSATAKGTAL